MIGMITFIRLINLPINVALKYLYSLSLIPCWNGHWEETLRPRFKGAFVAGSSFRVDLSVEGCFTQEHPLSGVTHTGGPFDAWSGGPMQSFMWARVLLCTGHSFDPLSCPISLGFPLHSHRCWSLLHTHSALVWASRKPNLWHIYPIRFN